MKNEIKDKLPQWYKNLNGKNAIITNDIDSLMGHYFINQKFGCQIKGFYNFTSTYFTDNNRKNLFGIDFDSLQGPTFGNHITHFYKNRDAINLNNVVPIKYYQKYPFSTTILILSLYDFNLESFSDEQLKILLAIDAGFKGYYANKQFFKGVYLQWLDRLGIRFLEDRILSRMTRNEFYDIIKKYNLSGSIAVDKDGYLKTNIDLDMISDVFCDKIALPEDKFHKYREYQYKVINPNYRAIPPRDKIFSMAWTDKDTLKMSLRI